MSGEPLCIYSFAEVFRERMNKKAHIKDFIGDIKTFDAANYELVNSGFVDLSDVYPFYKLLLDAVLCRFALENADAVPDINKTMTTQLKTGKAEVHETIKTLAQQKDAQLIVEDYFEINLIPNIPKNVLSVVLDNVDMLVQGDVGLGTTTRRALRRARKNKRVADYLAEVWLLAICNGNNFIDKRKAESAIQKRDPAAKQDPFAALKELDALLASIPSPTMIEPPEQIQQEEQPYINELYAAYGDKEGIIGFCDAHLSQYAEYEEDKKERRIDYFAAESIRRGVMEIYEGSYSNQFDILKEETYSGVRNTALMKFANGFERMLEVMQQACGIQVTQYVLSRSPDWISNRIKMGVCHFLVNEQKLRWVKR